MIGIAFFEKVLELIKHIIRNKWFLVIIISLGHLN